MNKMIIQSFNVLLILVTINNTIFSSDIKSSHNELLTFSACTAGICLASYCGIKLYSRYQEKKLSDPSEIFQSFARTVLNENDPKDTKLLPLKVGNEWRITGGSFMEIDSADVKRVEDALGGQGAQVEGQKEIIIADARYSLLHEKKHYYNNDLEKGVFLQGVKFIALNMLGRYINNPFFPIVSAIVSFKTIDSMIIRTQERDADLYAFENMPLKELIIVKAIYEVKAEDFEAYLFDHTNTKAYFSSLGSLSEEERKKKIRSDELIKTSDKLSSRTVSADISFPKRLIVEIASWFVDPTHPSDRSRVELAEECFKKKQLAMCVIGNH